MALLQSDNINDFFRNVEETEFLLTYISNPTCSACMAFHPKMTDFMKDLPEVDWLKIDAAVQQDVAAQNMVFSVPTVILFHKGVEVSRQSRFIDLQKIRYDIERFYGDRLEGEQ